MSTLSKIYEEIDHVKTEMISARTRFPPMKSPHEGMAIIRGEYLELEREVFVAKKDRDKMHTEAKQLAAMAICFMLECCYD